MQLHKCLLVSLTGVFATAVAAQSAGMPDLSAFVVGDRWEWRQFDNRTKLEESGTSVVVADVKGVRAVMVDGMQRPLDYPYTSTNLPLNLGESGHWQSVSSGRSIWITSGPTARRET